MKVSILQYNISWKNPEENLSYIELQLAQVPDETDLFILPEMFTTGVTTDVVEVGESMGGLTLLILKRWAAKYNLAICGSLMILENGNYYNRFVFVHPEGKVDIYDKRHLFILGGEDKVCKAGTACDIIEYRGWRIKPQICYDLRFPVWSRNTENYDLLIYVSNWPKARDFAYETLLRARAIENQCLVCACNRIGVDGSKIVYDGNSLIIDAKGITLADAKDREITLNYDLSMADLKKFRSRFPVLEDGDEFNLI